MSFAQTSQSQIRLLMSRLCELVSSRSKRGPPGDAAEMWQPTPTLTARSGRLLGPVVGARQSGREHRLPTRRASSTIVCAEKSSRAFSTRTSVRARLVRWPPCGVVGRSLTPWDRLLAPIRRRGAALLVGRMPKRLGPDNAPPRFGDEVGACQECEVGIEAEGLLGQVALYRVWVRYLSARRRKIVFPLSVAEGTKGLPRVPRSRLEPPAYQGSASRGRLGG